VADRLEIRTITEDEFGAAIVVTSAAFGENPTEGDIEAWQPAVLFDRTLAAFKDGRMDSLPPGGYAS